MAGKCGCNGACSCAMASSTSVSVSGTGAPSGPFTPSLRLDPAADNQIHVGTNGAIVHGPVLYGPGGALIAPDGAGAVTLPAPCILDYSGHPIPATSGGCIQLPTNGPPPAFGCGLTTAPDGTLKVATSGSWPTTDLGGATVAGTYTNGSVVTCGPDGKVRSPPEHTTINLGMAPTQLLYSLTTVPTSYLSPASPVVTIVNPSPSRRISCVAFFSITLDIIAPPASSPIVNLQTSINGGGWVTQGNNRRWPTSDVGTVRTQMEEAGRVPVVVPAGGSWTIATRAQVTKVGAGADPTIVEIDASIQVLGGTV